jgi:hypothetical protein
LICEDYILYKEKQKEQSSDDYKIKFDSDWIISITSTYQFSRLIFLSITFDISLYASGL